MKKLSDKQIARALSQRGTPEPPPGLARQIKAEIPGQIEVGGGAFERTGAGDAVRFGGLRPLWLIAASLLVVIGAGFMALRLLTPPADLSREIALGGVTRITEVVVTVPERSTVEGQKLAMAETDAAKTARGAAHPASSNLVAEATTARTQREAKAKAEEQHGLGKADTRAADRATQPGTVRASEYAPAPTAVAVMADALRNGGREGSAETGTVRAAAAPAPPAIAAAVPVGEAVVAQDKGSPGTSARAAAPKVLLAAAPARETVTVVVRTAAGAAVAGVPVSLVSLEKKDARPLEGVTGADGAVAFAAVPPGRYRATGRPAGGSAVVLEPLEVPAGQSRTFELRFPPPLP
jgi:hypothetical protein